MILDKKVTIQGKPKPIKPQRATDTQPQPKEVK
jgi:hypothetical protein